MTSRQAGVPIWQSGGLPPIKRDVKNSYAAAQLTRINSDWLMPHTSADAETFAAIKAVRARARQLERDNEYIPRYLTLLDNNVLGANGVAFWNEAKDPTGTLDNLANDSIGKAWKDFGSRKNLDVAGKLCFRESESVMLKRAAVDGGSMCRIHRGAQFKYGMALEYFEIDRLDHEYNTNLDNGNQVRFGIEMNRLGRVVAYHIFQSHPGDSYNMPAGPTKRERVLAEDIIHCYWVERPGQTLGMTWFACIMQAVEHLGKYQEAELVAARMEACKGYAIKPGKPEGWNGPKDDDGRQLQEMTPGMGMLLNPDEDIIQFDPKHPNTAFGEFIKNRLRGIAAGLGVSYNSLANDMSDVNFSSMRAGKLEEMEEYKAIQSWLIESYHSRVYEEWLKMALASAAIKMPNGSALPMAKYDKFNSPVWQPRRWPWVDPKADMDAAILAVEKGFKSRRQIIAEMGDKIENVFATQEQDEALAKQHKLEFPLGTNPQNPQPKAAQNLPTKP